MEEYDPQIMRQFMDELQRTGKVTKETSDQIAASGSTTTKYLQNLGKASKSASQDILKGSKDLASGLIEGQRGFEQLTPVLDAAANAIGGLVSIIPVFGKALEAGTQLVAEGGKLMLRQISTQLKSFQDISDVGAGALDGMTGLQRQFIASGLTLEDYTARVRSGSQALARFRGMATQGAEDFSLITGAITTQPLGEQLRLIGMSANDIGEFAEGYIARSTRLGVAQTMTNTQLASATVEYAKELDLLSKATGMSRKAIMQQQDAAMSEARFRSTLEGIQNEGVKTNLLNFQTSVNAVNAGIGQGVRDLASGLVTTEEAIALQAQTGGAAAVILDNLKAGLIDEFEARNQLQTAIRGNVSLLRDLGPAIGEASVMTRNAAGQFDFANATVTKTGFEVSKEQNKLAGGTNDLTNDMVQAQKNIEAMNIEMQRLFLAALPKAAGAVEGFTDTMLEAIGSISRRFLGEATEEERSKMEQFVFPKDTMIPGMDLNAMQSYSEAQKNLLAANVKPDVAIVKTAQIAGLHDAKKIAGASDDAPLASILGLDAVSKFGVATVGEFKSKIADMDLSKPSGPKQSYSSMTASLDTMTASDTTTGTTQQRSMDIGLDLMVKTLERKFDEQNELITKGNRIGERTYRSNLA